MKVSAAVNAVKWNSRSASNGRTVRSWPIIPPTRALTLTSRQNWARFCRSPSRGADAADVVVADDRTDLLVVADGVRLADEISRVLAGFEHEDQRPVIGHQPPEPRAELGAQRDGDRPGDVAGGPYLDGAGIDQHCARGEM